MLPEHLLLERLLSKKGRTLSRLATTDMRLCYTYSRKTWRLQRIESLDAERNRSSDELAECPHNALRHSGKSVRRLIRLNVDTIPSDHTDWRSTSWHRGDYRWVD